MTKLVQISHFFIGISMLQAAYGCNTKPANTTVPAPAIVKTTVTNTSAAIKNNSITDEQQFRLFFKKFKDAVKTNNKTQVTALFHFPLQTNPQWTNEDLKNSTINPKEGLVDGKEFLTYYKDIFTKEAIKLIPASKEDDLSEIDKNTPESYYKTLQQITDKSSTLYELQKQYAQDNGKETSFGFVFGKVGGSYKVISYYRPWPLKG